MEGGNEKRSDFYAVLGLKKECSEVELRNAYKKLALRWHPDRCSASGNLKYVEEAKKKFQTIQEAYSVLSDANKRFMYDVGIYDSDDDEDGMGDFLNEMAVLMSQNKSNEANFIMENEEGSFDELKNLFEEMFQSEIDAFSSSSHNGSSCSSLFSTYGESSNNSNKRDSSEMSFEKSQNEDSSGFDNNFHGFCFGVGHLKNYREGAARGCHPERLGSNSRSRKKYRLSSAHNVHLWSDFY